MYQPRAVGVQPNLTTNEAILAVSCQGRNLASGWGISTDDLAVWYNPMELRHAFIGDFGTVEAQPF